MPRHASVHTERGGNIIMLKGCYLTVEGLERDERRFGKPVQKGRN